MKTLYIECQMGAAGDMLMAALMDLLDDQDKFIDKMNHLGIPGLHIHAERVVRAGIQGNHVHVHIHGEEEGSSHHHHHHHEAHHHEHHHSGLTDIQQLIDSLDISDRVKTDAKAVYQIIAKAESAVHGQQMEQIHFHEVGTLDAVADVVGCCILMEEIHADRIVVSPIHVGSGTVACAHGILPVPAPATARILEGLPIYGGEIKGELCTPTGAALLKYFGQSFGPMPSMTMEKMGIGMGTKEFTGYANGLRVMVGKDGDGENQVVELAANIDDMTAEELGFALEVLMKAGALDVYCEHILMKKSRPAVKFVCLCRLQDQEKMAALMFKHTTTIGVRGHICTRFTLDRRVEQIETAYGPVDVKVCEGFGVRKQKGEFDQMARLAEEKDVSIFAIKKEIHE